METRYQAIVERDSKKINVTKVITSKKDVSSFEEARMNLHEFLSLECEQEANTYDKAYVRTRKVDKWTILDDSTEPVDSILPFVVESPPDIIGGFSILRVNKKELIALLDKHYPNDIDSIAVITTVETSNRGKSQSICFSTILE